MNFSIEEQQSFYDRWNVRFRRRSFDEIPEEIRLRALHLVGALRALKLDSPLILEVGCGTGWLAEKLCNLGPVTAIDLSPAAIAIARERKTAATFLTGDFHECEFQQRSFDVAVCIETLFYVPDQPRFVRKLASLTKHGGYLAISTINKFVYERSSDVLPPEPGQVRRWLTRKETRKLLDPYFEILSMTTVEPRGSMGVLRLVNSQKVNALLNRLFSQAIVRRAKERIGLGGGVVILARRKASADIQAG